VHKIVASWAGYKAPLEVEDLKHSPVFIATPEDARRHMAMTGGKVPGVGNG
jgi:hypothetical protein